MSQSEIVIQAGSDPRGRDEFSSIRQEINNINHPSRPEVNWGVIEQLSLLLFKNHGVDLQTACYYCLARTKKHGLAGFTEGIELIAGLIFNQWDAMWPEQLQIRADILEWLNQKVGAQLRSQTYDTVDLRELYRAERALEIIINKLQQYPIQKLPKLENILYLLQNQSKKIEQGMTKNDHVDVNIQQPQLVFAPNVIKAEEPPKPFEPIIETNLYNTEVLVPAKVKSSKTPIILSFMTGALLALVCVSGFYFYHDKQNQPTEMLAKQFKTHVLNTEDANLLRREYGVNKIADLSNIYMPVYENEITKVLAAAPLAELVYGQSLIDNANVLWPDLPLRDKLVTNWYESLELQSNQAKHSLDKLALAKLTLSNFKAEAAELKQQKGKYMTLGYIEDNMQKIELLVNEQNQIESLLAQFEALENKKNDPTAVRLKKQIDEKFNQLLIYYFLLANPSQKD